MKLPDEPLAPTPSGSAWGRTTVRVYLGVVAVVVVLLVMDLARGQSGSGTFFLSVVTAPWSALLAPLAGALRGPLGERGMVVAGLLLAAGCVALNARIAYGIAARMERDAARKD